MARKLLYYPEQKMADIVTYNEFKSLRQEAAAGGKPLCFFLSVPEKEESKC